MSAMNVLVIHESLTGNTARAADLMGAEFRAAGHDTTVTPTTDLRLQSVIDADLVIVGTWVDGLVLFGHRPGGAGKLNSNLPTMWDKPTYAFVTYAINAGNALGGLTSLLESKGADVRGGLALHRKHLDTDAPDFVDGVLAAFSPA